MKTIVLFLILFANHGICQKIYKADREAYRSNKYSYKFYLYNDSSCYLKGNYNDNSQYFIYKGVLRKANDLLYEFIFQPVVDFSCNKGYHIQDSGRFYFAQIDTLITSLKFNVKAEYSGWTTVQLKGEKTTVFIKGIENKPFLINTKFKDPISHENIIITAGKISDPDLTYYGGKTTFYTLKIVFTKKGLILYPDHKFIQDKDVFVLEK